MPDWTTKRERSIVSRKEKERERKIHREEKLAVMQREVRWGILVKIDVFLVRYKITFHDLSIY